MPNPVLFTPGPVQIPPVVAEAFQDPPCNYHRQKGFRELFRGIELDLKTLLGVRDQDAYFATLLTCTGTGANEACLITLAPTGKGLILSNGFFGDRILHQAQVNQIDHLELRLDPNQPINVDVVEDKLRNHPDLRWVFFVSHETRVGLINPVASLGQRIKQLGRIVAADIVSSAYAYPIDMEAAELDLAVASSAKALMAIPGIGIVFVRRSSVSALSAQPRQSYYLDIIAEYERQLRDSEPRFAQPVALYAALAAACCHLKEVGIANHMARIRQQMAELTDHLAHLGVPPMLAQEHRSGIATNFRLPSHLPYSLFASRMGAAGYFLLYGIPGDQSHFQLSTIGDINDDQIRGIKSAFAKVLR